MIAKIYTKEERNEKGEQTVVVKANVSQWTRISSTYIRHLHNAIACVLYSKLANLSI